MNLPTLIVLALVAVALFFALRAYLRGRGRGECGCESPGGCSGCSAASCPHCQSQRRR